MCPKESTTITTLLLLRKTEIGYQVQYRRYAIYFLNKSIQFGLDDCGVYTLSAVVVYLMAERNLSTRALGLVSIARELLAMSVSRVNKHCSFIGASINKGLRARVV